MADFTDANRKYFDQMATAYKDRFANIIKTLSEQTLKHRSWISDRWTDTEAGRDQEIKMLEYACGPGVISMTLVPFLTQVVGVDVSDNMVDEFNRNASTVGAASKMTGYKADLLSDSAPAEFSGPEFNDFDVVAVSMALHHFEHPDLALQRLAKRLKKGGVFYIIDFVPHSGHDHLHAHHEHAHGDKHGEHKHEYGDAAHTVKTNGFSKEDMQKLFQGAGLSVGYDYQILSEQLVFNKEDKTFSKTAFIARAQLA